MEEEQTREMEELGQKHGIYGAALMVWGMPWRKVCGAGLVEITLHFVIFPSGSINNGPRASSGGPILATENS